MASFGCAELQFDEASVAPPIASPSTRTPDAKRQRRLTLTAMTGLICELSQECPDRAPRRSQDRPQVAPAAASTVATPASKAPDAVQMQRPSEVVPPARDSSPMKRLKRSRASIGATASAAVMAAQAAKTLTAPSPTRPGQRSSESSDSTEEDDDSLALRVRRAQAFECGALAVDEPVSTMPRRPPAAAPSPGAPQQGDLSPRSKSAFDRGLRAAQVAAKVAASLMPTKTADTGATLMRPRGGA